MATLQRESDVAATREAVVAGLSAYNAARVGPRNSEPLALSLRDDAGTIARKLQKARTDAAPLPDAVEGLEGRPEARNLVEIYARLTPDELAEKPENLEPTALA